MATINSVLGPMDTKDFGFTLMHEHILVASAGTYRDYPELLGPNPVEQVVETLKKTKAGGIDTIVDTTTLDLGRNINLLKETSEQSGVNIIACTGWWLDFPRFWAGVSADQLAKLFIREIEQGISGTDIKAGILKSASDMEGVTPEGETVLRAVARAHLRTHTPIVLHTYAPGRVADQQLSVLKEEGVDLKRVKIDHSNDTTDVEYLIQLLEKGCYLGLDRYPGRNVSPMARTKTLKALIDEGFAHRLCPSHDGTILFSMAEDPGTKEEEHLEQNPYGFLYMKEVVIPMLSKMGVNQKTINKMFIDNPRTFFEGV